MSDGKTFVQKGSCMICSEEAPLTMTDCCVECFISELYRFGIFTAEQMEDLIPRLREESSCYGLAPDEANHSNR